MQAVRLDPLGAGLALPGGAAPLGRAPRRIGARERPSPVLALGRAMVAALHAGSLLERDDRATLPVLASGVDRKSEAW